MFEYIKILRSTSEVQNGSQTLLDIWKHISLNPAAYLKERKQFPWLLSGSYKDSLSSKGQMPVCTLVSGQYVSLLKV